MRTAQQFVAWPRSGGDQTQPAHLHYGLLAQVAACIVPAMVAVSAGDPALGARWLFLSLLVLLAAHCLLGTGLSALTLIVGLLPGLMLLRTLFVYNSVVVLLAAGLAVVLLRSPAAWRFLGHRLLVSFSLLALLYWLLSYIQTGDYAVNLRVLELLCSAAAVLVLLVHPEYLATAMFGVLCSLITMGLALLRYGDRLGMARIGDTLLGNPVAFGIPLALILLLANADGGRRFLLQRRLATRWIVSVGAGLLLLLSASRASWLVAGTCMLMIVLVNRYHRQSAALTLMLLVVAAALVLQTRRGLVLSAWYNRTFSEGQTLSQRTSGRSDQWMIFPDVLRDLPIWGFGPGSGGEIYARYSARDPRVRLHPGSELAWHSLYQHITVETGLAGLIVLLAFLALLLRGDYRWWQRSGELSPLLGTTGFMLIALTVSGMDAASGLFLGLGLLPNHLTHPPGAGRLPAQRSPSRAAAPMAPERRDVPGGEPGGVG